MAIDRISADRLSISREMSASRLNEYLSLALNATQQQAASTNAYYALNMALHWLEIAALGYKTTCHTELLHTGLEVTLAGLTEAGVVDDLRRQQAWIIFHYWIVGYWDGDPGSAHLDPVKYVLADFYNFFYRQAGAPSGLVSIPPGQYPVLPDNARSALLAEVKMLHDTLDVGEW